mgnify:FL=1
MFARINSNFFLLYFDANTCDIYNFTLYVINYLCPSLDLPSLFLILQLANRNYIIAKKVIFFCTHHLILTNHQNSGEFYLYKNESHKALFRGFWLKHSYNFYRSECVIISYDILIIIQIYIFCNPFYKTLHIFLQKCKPIIFSITKTPIKTPIFRAFSPIFVIYYP